MTVAELSSKTMTVFIRNIGVLSCTCGNIETGIYHNPYECTECANSPITEVERLNKKGRIRVDSVLELINKDDRSFHVKKDEIYLEVDHESFQSKLKVGKQFELKWSLKDRTLEMYRNGKKVEDRERFSSFFRGISHEKVLNLVSTEGNRQLLKFAFKNLGKMYDERTENLIRALYRLFSYPNLELFNFAGYGHLLEDIWRYNEWKISKETKPHKILNVPKYMTKYIKKLSYLYDWELENWRKFDKKFGGNNVKTVLEILDEESDINRFVYLIELYEQLYDEYGYRNHERLINYLARDIKLMQGITDPVDGARTLRDYVRMCKEMGINPEKYSKNLRKDHDIAAMNYQMMQDEVRHEQFKKEMEKPIWDELLYENKKYTIVKPTEPQDLIEEGESLGHCVASYVNDVIKGKCKIFFLRLADMKDEGLVTIEIRGNNRKDLRIVQVKGRGNRNPVASEKAFIEEWAEKKGLKVSY